MKTILSALALTVAFATAASAEDIFIQEPDGTEWTSYSAPRVCIRAAVQRALKDEAEITETPISIGGFYNGASNEPHSEYFVSLLDVADGDPIIASITHHYNINYGEIKSSRGGVLSYEPQTLNMGTVMRSNEYLKPQQTLTYLVNGAFALEGYGESDYSAEEAIRNLDMALRSCNLMM